MTFTVLLLLARPEFRPVMENATEAAAKNETIANRVSVAVAVAVAVGGKTKPAEATASANSAGSTSDDARPRVTGPRDAEAVNGQVESASGFETAFETIQQQNTIIEQQHRQIQKLQRRQIHFLQQQLSQGRKTSKPESESSADSGQGNSDETSTAVDKHSRKKPVRLGAKKKKST